MVGRGQSFGSTHRGTVCLRFGPAPYPTRGNRCSPYTTTGTEIFAISQNRFSPRLPFVQPRSNILFPPDHGGRIEVGWLGKAFRLGGCRLVHRRQLRAIPHRRRFVLGFSQRLVLRLRSSQQNSGPSIRLLFGGTEESEHTNICEGVLHWHSFICISPYSFRLRSDPCGAIHLPMGQSRVRQKRNPVEAPPSTRQTLALFTHPQGNLSITDLPASYGMGMMVADCR